MTEVFKVRAKTVHTFNHQAYKHADFSIGHHPSNVKADAIMALSGRK